MGPSVAQLERAQRQAARAQHEAQRDAAIARLRQLFRDTTTVHLQTFPAAAPPQVPPPPQLTLPWAVAEAKAHHLQGVSRLARSERNTAKLQAEIDVRAYREAETARLEQVHRSLVSGAHEWWTALTTNDELTVCEAVNTAFADNPSAGCAVGVTDSVMSVVMRQQDLEAMPTQEPSVTAAGRPTLKTMRQRDRMLWWYTMLASNVVATLKEGFATAPSVTAIDLAVLTRLSGDRRLGFIVYGRWTRRAICESPWRTVDDALRFLDLGQDVASSVRFTASGNMSASLKPLNTSGVPALQELLGSIREEPDTGDQLGALDVALTTGESRSTGAQDPYALRSFAEWKLTSGQRSTSTPSHHRGHRSPPLMTAPSPPRTDDPAAQQRPADASRPHNLAIPLVSGQRATISAEALEGLQITLSSRGTDVDLTMLLLASDGRVPNDAHFVFYNQPEAPTGDVRLLGKRRDASATVEAAFVRLSTVPAYVQRIVIAANVDDDSRATFSSVHDVTVNARAADGSHWAFTPGLEPHLRAVVLAELYRHQVEENMRWKLKVVGQGWSGGLASLAHAHGVDIE